MDVTVICRTQPSWFHFWRKLGEKMCQTGVLLTDLPTAERCPSGHTKEQHSGTARHSVVWRGTARGCHSATGTGAEQLPREGRRFLY